MLTPDPDRDVPRTRAVRQTKRWVALMLGAGAMGVAVPAVADGTTSQAQGQALAQIVRPLTVAGIQDLDFGMVASSGPGSVVIAPGAAGATYGGRARSACTGSDPCPPAHPARFEVSGEALRYYRIALPERLGIAASPTTQAGGEVIIAGLAVRTANQPGAGTRGRLGATGSDAFEVGGTLIIAAALPPGHYRVTVPVTVTYD
jgi:hypothetical protein